MLPSEKTKPKIDLTNLTVLIYGKGKIGKCLKGDTIMYDSVTGRPVTLKRVVEKKHDIMTMKHAGIIQKQTPSAFITNEPDQLFKLTTQTGRSIEATEDHPFLTRGGWKPLKELKCSDRVAIIAEYPDFFGTTRTDDSLLKILAYLIADGNFKQSIIFTKIDPEVRLDFENAVEKKGDECIEFENDRGIPHVRVRGKKGSPNNVIAFLKEVGLHGLRSGDKFIPDFVFGLNKRRLSLFLNRLFTCDGSVEMGGRVSYSSKSVRMVYQIQHLLVRFGIVGLVRRRQLNKEPYGAELLIASKENVLKFIDQIGFYGEKAVKAETVRSSLYNVRSTENQIDRVGPIVFDRVKSVEPTTTEVVYDLTVDGSHNFIANDFVVHNSTWCSQADDVLFLATEPGLNALEVHQMPITNWHEFSQACFEIGEGKHKFKTIVIDTIDNAHAMCAEYVCKKNGIDHESDLRWGKGHALVKNELWRVLTKLAFLPYGLIFVSHSQDVIIESRTGKYNKTVPTLPDKICKLVVSMVDLILYCDFESEIDKNNQPVDKRIIRTKPSKNYDAGDRTCLLPEKLPLDFNAFVKYFDHGNNENNGNQNQKDTNGHKNKNNN
jgi:intein/homing endonuclease